MMMSVVCTLLFLRIEMLFSVEELCASVSGKYDGPVEAAARVRSGKLGLRQPEQRMQSQQHPIMSILH